MARYIDTEKINLPKGFFNTVDNVPKFYEWVETLPTADVVEVVRCKDCIFSKRDMDVHPDPKILNKDRWCELYGRKSPDWFCADGERREDE